MLRVAGKSFRPRPLNALGVLIRVKVPDEEFLPGYDYTNGWGDFFARGIDVLETPGDHSTLME